MGQAGTCSRSFWPPTSASPTVLQAFDPSIPRTPTSPRLADHTSPVSTDGRCANRRLLPSASLHPDPSATGMLGASQARTWHGNVWSFGSLARLVAPRPLGRSIYDPPSFSITNHLYRLLLPHLPKDPSCVRPLEGTSASSTVEVYPKRPKCEGLGPMVDPSHGRFPRPLHEEQRALGITIKCRPPLIGLFLIDRQRLS